MYHYCVRQQKAHLFPNGEVFICTAEIFEEKQVIEWSIPQYAVDKFDSEIKKIEINNPFDSFQISKEKSLICRIFDIAEKEVTINTSAQYDIGDKNGYDYKEIMYNQIDEIELTVKSQYDKFYYDKEQKTTVKIIDGELAAIAFDNKNGAITVFTKEQYRNKGYATQCVQKLIYMYPEDEKDKIGWGTTIENIASQKVAEKSGMKRTSFGYWVRISEIVGKEYYQNHQKYFE